METIYNCTLDSFDKLIVDESDLGIRIRIEMAGLKNKDLGFNEPAIILSIQDSIKLINNLKNLIDNGK